MPMQYRPAHGQRLSLDAAGTAVAPQVAGREPAYKRPFDLLVVTSAHLLLLPLWLLLWTLIPFGIWIEDRGPILYTQRRVGKAGRVFRAFKFRTMVRDADRIGGPVTTNNDPRLTRFGKLIRATALDELPQVINIARGDMSFVGPRALAEAEYNALVDQEPLFAQRVRVRPGLTGLAQVYTRRDDNAAKLAADLDYISRMSLWLDVKLIFLSVWTTLHAKWESRIEKEGVLVGRHDAGSRGRGD